VRRRRLLQWTMGLAAAQPLARARAVVYPPVLAGRALNLPADHGAHPEFRNEWWYVTGWLDGGPAPLGFQVTFFRNRPGIAEDLPVATAPRQLLFAHAALADGAAGRLLHDQRSARAAWGLAYAREDRLEVAIDDWSLRTDGAARLHARVRAAAFGFDLAMEASAPLLPEGEGGFSRKGPGPAQASYYYSWPQLRVRGRVEGGAPRAVEGVAWLDHEWSSEYMAAGAVGWDWTGINLEDGGALMAFRMRAADGSALWAGGTWRRGDGSVQTLARDDLRFDVLRRWRSPATGAVYPVAIRLTAVGLTVELNPLFDAQELDARASVGTVYWEGAVEARSGGRPIGRGYLELTGYAGRFTL
jgi:predicted secreted hydrolase